MNRIFENFNVFYKYTYLPIANRAVRNILIYVSFVCWATWARVIEKYSQIIIKSCHGAMVDVAQDEAWFSMQVSITASSLFAAYTALIKLTSCWNTSNYCDDAHDGNNVIWKTDDENDSAFCYNTDIMACRA